MTEEFRIRPIGLPSATGILAAAVLMIGGYAGADTLIAESGEARMVLVAGATGQTGQLIVGQLLERGYRVRAVSRSLERAAALGPEIEAVQGDVTDPGSLDSVVDGVDAVVSAIGGRWPIGSNGFRSVDFNGNVALIDAAKAHGASRFIVITAGSAGRDGFLYSLPFGPYPWKARAEAYLRDSGLDYTIIAPGGLRDEAGGKTGIAAKPRDAYEVGTINRADVAAVVVASLEMDATIGRTITVINDADLPVSGWRDALQELPADGSQ
jgi:uncharacterized protein YbjT (DUF2867 family)